MNEREQLDRSNLASPPDDCTVLSISAVEHTVLVATDLGLWRRGGEEWRLLPPPFVDQVVATIVATDASTRLLLAAGLAGAVQYSPDGGAHWYGTWLDQIVGSVTCFAPSPSFAIEPVIVAGTQHDGLLRSTDGGRRWRLENFGLTGYTVLALAATPDWRAREEFFAATDEGIYRSSNGGRAWQRTHGCDTGAQALAISPQYAADRTLYAGSEEQGLYRSTDAGRTWRLRSAEVAGINGLWIAPHDPLLLVAGTADGALLRSTDGGESWQHGWSGTDAVLALAGSQAGLYAGLYQGGLLMSLDGGLTWQRESVTTPALP